MAIFAMLLDIVIAFLLVGTIYYAWRLSEGLMRFRNNRAEMERLIRELNNAVLRAQESITALREAADTSGNDLQKIMRGAAELSDELQLMTESANSLASRLEQASLSRPVESISGPLSRHPAAAENGFPGFNIRDPEFDGAVPDRAVAVDDDDWSGVEDLRSNAEKELFRALQKNKKGSRSVM